MSNKSNLSKEKKESFFESLMNNGSFKPILYKTAFNFSLLFVSIACFFSKTSNMPEDLNIIIMFILIVYNCVTLSYLTVVIFEFKEEHK